MIKSTISINEANNSNIIGIQQGPTIEDLRKLFSEFLARPDLPQTNDVHEIQDLPSLAEKLIVKVGHSPLSNQELIPIAKKLLVNAQDKRLIPICFDHLAKRLRNTGEYREALQYAFKALQIRREILKPDSTEIGESLCNLSVIHRYLGNLQESRSYADDAISFYKSCDVLNKFTGLATAIYKKTLTMIELSRISEAIDLNLEDESFLEQAVKEGELCQDHVYFAETLNARGELQSRIRDYHLAINLKRKALDLRKARLEPNHPDIASSCHQIADLYFKVEEYKDANKFATWAFDIRKEVLPPNHPAIRESNALRWKAQEFM